MKKITLIFITSICILVANAHAVGISPPGIEAGTLDLTTPDTFLFEIKNLNNIPYTLNLTFETTPSSNYLEPYITFTPPAMQITPQDKKTNFTITITSGIPAGNHLLIFIPRIEFIEPEPQMNDTGNINTAGTILSTSAAYIDFTIPEVPPPPPPDPPGSGAAPADVPISPEEIINLTIEAPLHVKAVEPSVTVTIKLKNTGDITLKNLTLELISTPSLNLEYDNQIGTLYPNQQKAINVKLSNFTGTDYFIGVLVSDSETQKNWTANFTVHVPDEPRGTISLDCIEYTPKNFKVTANKKSQIKLDIKNKCNISLHNLNTRITTLGYSEVIETLNLNETRTISIDVLLPPGISDHEIVFTYAEGEATGHITIDAAVSFMTLILRAIASILLFILLIYILLFLLHLYRKNINGGIKKESHKDHKLSDIKEKIYKLKLVIKTTDDLLSKHSRNKDILECKISEKRQELDYAERTEEQLKTCLENLKKSIESKEMFLESSKGRVIPGKIGEIELLKNELKQLEKSIKAKTELLNSFRRIQNPRVNVSKHRLKNILNNLKLYLGNIYLRHRHTQKEKYPKNKEYQSLKYHIESKHRKSAQPKAAIQDTHAKRQAYKPRIEESGYKTILNHLRSYIRNIFKLHKDSKKEQLPEKQQDKSAKYRIEPNLEKPMAQETTPMDTLTQKGTYPEEEKIYEKFLGQLESSIEQEQRVFNSFKTEEDFLDNPVFKDKIVEHNFNNLQSVIGEEKELLRTLKTEAESVHIKSKTYRESLIGYQKELTNLSNVKNVRMLQEKKKSAQDVLLALERLYGHNIIGKDVYESPRFVELELNSIDKIISKNLKEDIIKEEPEQIAKKKPKAAKKARHNRNKTKNS